MRQLKFMAAALMAVFSLAAITAATASAAATLPNVLPEGTSLAPITSTGTSGPTKFGSGALEIKSKKSTSKQLIALPKLGTFDVLFEGSTDAAGTLCIGLGDTEEGSILALGTFHYFDYNRGGELLVAVGFLLLPVHFSCGSAILVIVQGCVAGAITTPVNTLSKTLEVFLTAKSGDNEIITVLNAENEKAFACQLLASVNEGAFELSSQSQTQVLLGFKKGSTAEEILVMPL
jgi:hypothetical protein